MLYSRFYSFHPPVTVSSSSPTSTHENSNWPFFFGLEGTKLKLDVLFPISLFSFFFLFVNNNSCIKKNKKVELESENSETLHSKEKWKLPISGF